LLKKNGAEKRVKAVKKEKERERVREKRDRERREKGIDCGLKERQCILK
jgi:hypothetical protein